MSQSIPLFSKHTHIMCEIVPQYGGLIHELSSAQSLPENLALRTLTHHPLGHTFPMMLS